MIFGILTMLEFVGKCIPVVNEIINSAVAFVVPIFILIALLALHGLFATPASTSTEVRELHPKYYDYNYDDRRLEEGGSSGGGGTADLSAGEAEQKFLFLPHSASSVVPCAVFYLPNKHL